MDTTSKKTCTTCGQVLPKRVPQARDIVQLGESASGKPVSPRLGILLDGAADTVFSARFGPPMKGYIRVTALTGPLAGFTTQWPVDRLTVVHGHFHVTECL